MLAQLARQLLARPGQIPQLLHSARRHEAAAQQPMRQQIRQPHRIVHVALTAGDIAHVRRIREDELVGRREHVPHRLPVHARRFHRDVRAPTGAQPISEREQARGRRRKRAHFRLRASAPHHARARHHRRLVHIQSGTPGIEHVHRGLLHEAVGVKPQEWRSLPSVLEGR